MENVDENAQRADGGQRTAEPVPPLALIRAICRKEGLRGDEIRPLSGGQVNQVYLVDGAYVVRVGGREGAGLRLGLETDLLRRLEGRARVAKVYAMGLLEERAYQIQAYMPGRLLYRAWTELGLAEQEGIAAELAESLRALHGLGAPWFGDPRQPERRFEHWEDFVADRFQRTLDELAALQIRMAPGIVEMAAEYFERNRSVLCGGNPSVVHSDLTLVNLLEHGGRLSALLDFEFAMYAPPDYELWAIEAFCLYPNDWAEEGHEVFCAADFARFVPLLRRHYPALFEVEHLRARVDLYQVCAALGSYLAWRKANLDSIPPERMAAKEFYIARISNFIFGHGAKMF